MADYTTLNDRAYSAVNDTYALGTCARKLIAKKNTIRLSKDGIFDYLK